MDPIQNRALSKSEQLEAVYFEAVYLEALLYMVLKWCWSITNCNHPLQITNSKEISMIYFCSQYVLLLLIESAGLLHSDGSTNKTKMLDDPVTAGPVDIAQWTGYVVEVWK